MYKSLKLTPEIREKVSKKLKPQIKEHILLKDEL